MLFAFVSAAVLVSAAEFGDKTQMLTLVLAARYGARRVIIGVGIAVLALQMLAVVAGAVLGSLIPGPVVAWVTGILFIGFGIATLVMRPEAVEGEDAHAGESGSRRPILGTALAFFLAELGDKTQLMTMAIAADPLAAAGLLGVSVGEGQRLPVLLGVWAGSVVGMMLVNGAAALIGSALGSRVSPSLIARVSGVVFIGFGLLVVGSQVFAG